MLLTIWKGLLTNLLEGFLNVFTTHASQEFDRFTRASLPGVPARGSPEAAPAPPLINVQPLTPETAASNPADCEELFTRLVQAGHLDSAWELLSPDSQASWGHRDTFRQAMESRQLGHGVVATRVRQVRLLPTWTDSASNRTYRQVAELIVDYHIRQNSRERTVTKDVHLVNVSGGWKSLCYRT